MRSKWTVTLMALMAFPVVPAWAQNTQRGAAVGGVTGAIAGAIIGDHNDEAGAGALIGGAVGALTGAVVGNAKDKEQAYSRYQTQQYYHQAAVAQQQAVSSTDVVTMARSGVSDGVIVNQINQRGIQRRLEVAEIIAMHQQGVSETVISAMQRAPVGTPATYVVPARPAPVVVERVEVVPTYVYPRYYRPHHHHHFHARFGW